MCSFKLLCLVTVLCLLKVGAALAEPVQRDHIEVELISELAQIVPGEAFWVGLRLAPDEHWHTYWRNPGDSGLETRIQWVLPEGSSYEDIRWPYPERVDMAGIINYGYDGEVLLLSKITPPKHPVSDHFSVIAKSSWLVCDDVCIPGEASLSLSLPYAHEMELDAKWQAKIVEAQQRWPQTFERNESRYELIANEVVIELSAEELSLNDPVQYFPISKDVIEYSALQSIFVDRLKQQIYIRQQKSGYFNSAPETLSGVIVLSLATGKRAYQLESIHDAVHAEDLDGLERQLRDANKQKPFLLILVFAFLGGLILNLMPCVFPVLSLKALSLIKHARESGSNLRLQGLAYTLGVVLSFIAIAALMLMLREAGERIGWGFQLQLPWFIASLIFVFFILALSLSGALTINASWFGAGQSLTTKRGNSGAFFTGALAALVATPCTAPFMGPAMGFAITQTTTVALFIFAFLGLGMASPFLLISLSPRFARYLPRPGGWMQTFKEAMAFPLYLTVVYLLWVLGKQTDINTVALVLVGLLLLVLAVWLNCLVAATQATRFMLKSLMVMCLLLVLSIIFSLSHVGADSASSLHSKPFSTTLLKKLRDENKLVFVNLTADWCITCKVNERTTLASEKVRTAFQKRQVEYLVGDWTLRDAEITAMLEQYDRNGVPLYLVYLPGAQYAQVLPQLLTPATVVEILK